MNWEVFWTAFGIGIIFAGLSMWVYLLHQVAASNAHKRHLETVNLIHAKEMELRERFGQ